METYQTIIIEQNKAVASIWLNRPEKHNAMNQEMVRELTDAFQALSFTDEIRVIVLRGKGKSFCAGADLEYMRSIATFGSDENELDAFQLATLFDLIYRCPKAVIAVLHGAVYGGANGLSAASDIVLADEATVFAFSEVKLGITPATISPYVILRAGEAPARELMLTGRKFTAVEALRFMLVNCITTAEDAEKQLQFYTNQLLTAAPFAVAECKKLIRYVSGQEPSEQLMNETSKRIAKQRASAEGQEGMAAFFEKRNPNWISE